MKKELNRRTKIKSEELSIIYGTMAEKSGLEIGLRK